MVDARCCGCWVSTFECRCSWWVSPLGFETITGVSACSRSCGRGEAFGLFFWPSEGGEARVCGGAGPFGYRCCLDGCPLPAGVAGLAAGLVPFKGMRPASAGDGLLGAVRLLSFGGQPRASAGCCGKSVLVSSSQAGSSCGWRWCPRIGARAPVVLGCPCGSGRIRAGPSGAGASGS